MKPVFVHIPKTAGKSVRAALKNVPDLLDIGHSNLQNYGRDQRNKGAHFDPQDHFSICFVRNPFSRLRSAFYHLLDVNTDSPGINAKDIIQKRAGLFNTYGTDFESFVLDRGFEKFDISHFYPQAHWYLDKKGERCINFIGYFETLRRDFTALALHLQHPDLSIPHKNKTGGEKYASGNREWTPEMIDVCHDFYRIDFDYLGYDTTPQINQQMREIPRLITSKDLMDIPAAANGNEGTKKDHIFIPLQVENFIKEPGLNRTPDPDITVFRHAEAGNVSRHIDTKFKCLNGATGRSNLPLLEEIIQGFAPEKPTQPIYTVCLENASVFGDFPEFCTTGFPIVSSRHYLHEFVRKKTRQQMMSLPSDLSLTLESDGTLHHRKANRPHISINGPALYLQMFDNWDHTLFEALPALSIIEEMGIRLSDLAVLTRHIGKDDLSILSNLGVRPSQVVQTQQQIIHAHKLYVTSFLKQGNIQAPTPYAYRTADKILEKIESRGRNWIYVSRRLATKRKIMNENALEKELARRGFIIIDPGTLSKIEQAQLFRTAEVIVGPHGMGMANAVFAKDVRLMVEIHHTNWRNAHYFRIAQFYGAAYFGYFLEPAVESTSGGYTMIPVQNFLTELDDSLQRAGLIH